MFFGHLSRIHILRFSEQIDYIDIRFCVYSHILKSNNYLIWPT